MSIKLKTLYKRSTTGKINEFTVEVEDNKFRTITGYVGMTLTTSAWTVCEGKSYNTSSEQALKQAQALHRKKMELGCFENIEDVDKEVHFKPMLANDFNDYKSKIKYPIYSQPKLDGVRCICKSDGMWSRNGKKIISAPHIFEALKPLFEVNPDLILDGELYAERSTCDFNKIISCVRKTKPEVEDMVESAKYIQYWIYDLPSCDEKFSIRIDILAYLPLPSCCKVVKTYIVHDEKEVMVHYKEYIKADFEGQILRVNDVYENKRSKSLLKHKTFFDDEYIIRGIIEGKGKLTGKVGKLMFDGFESAVNGDHEYLEKLWKIGTGLIGRSATVKYFELTSEGVPRFPKVINIGREEYE